MLEVKPHRCFYNKMKLLGALQGDGSIAAATITTYSEFKKTKITMYMIGLIFR